MKITQAVGTAMLNALTGLANNGTLVIYSSIEPTNPDTALSGNTALATFTFAATAFGSNSLSGGNEVENASFTATSVTAAATGTATFARMYKSDGVTVLADFSVGTSAADVILNTTSITSGGTVTITGFGLQMPVD